MDAYVVFDKRHTPKCHFWHYLLPADWSHCFVILDYGCQTVIVDPLLSGISVTLEDYSISQQVKSLKQYGVTAILKMNLKKRPAVSFARWHGLLTCVSVVKSVLGIQDFCMRPLALYRLLKTKGEIIYEEKKMYSNVAFGLHKLVQLKKEAKEKAAAQTAERQQQEAITHAAEIKQKKKMGRSSNSLISSDSILSYLRALLG